MTKEKRNLLETHPELCEQWDYENNNGLRPEYFTAGSSKEINWVLPYDDERTGKHFDFRWSARIYQRSKKKSTLGCPYLSGHAVWVGYNDLTSYPEYKYLIDEWDYEANYPYRPKDFSKGSEYEAYWILHHFDKRTGKHFDFKWQATINHRTSKKIGCPYLTGAKVWPGFNDLTTYPEYKHLIDQWDYELNEYGPEHYTVGSNNTVNWVLPYDDERTGKHFDFKWTAQICHRTAKKEPLGCPYLSGQKVWVGYNDLTSYPEYKYLVDEWDYEANYPYRPEDFTKSSAYEAHWILPYDDERTGKHFDFKWKAQIRSRTDKKKPQGCPYISGREVWQGYNDLTTYPECKHLVEEWDYEKNYPNKPEDFTKGRGYEAYWKKRHYDERTGKWFDFTWQATIASRTNKHTLAGCPYLTGQKVWLGFNDLTSYLEYKDLVEQWDYESNYPHRPENFTKSSPFNAYWICPKGHKYQHTIHNRTQHGCGCRECSGSVIERLAYAILRKYNIDFELEYNFKGLGQKRYDVYIESNNVLLELDGQQHFQEIKTFNGSLKDRIKSDNKKNKYALDNQIPILRIPYIYSPGKDKGKIESLIMAFIETKQVPEEIIDFYSKYEFSNYPEVSRKLNEMYAHVGK